ncbi:hypothetical protein OS189_05150 [Sulfitobacter sp. F26169L]|uniref:hypothetical protein n=1 Tax=Sulfitobacter sp. F26169L TaxID=2996015 RepID=UPI00226086BD|nr:hypothetical protein [Sulfitobacter sp. F26169L]MCX7565720.1 hypothetical protein [Sulfitobacter sp. F26169L]
MTTWTSKPLAALGIAVLLSACDAATTGGGLLDNLKPPSDAALPPAPLTQALMMRGKVTLVPPTGFCIDPESLSQSFALMARCDTLGAATGGAGAPLGMMTVSFARNTKNIPLPSAQEIATASGLGPPLDVRNQDTSVVFKTTGKAPVPDLAAAHWRSVAQVGGFFMGAALYGPEGRRAVSTEGASFLQEMIKRTADKTTTG